ncbi:hypothetical protein HU200_041366 [Digitaria exilis]|uniref:Uncharacterized protein n=1 Tax=Digitaria exilis TaxID=1010633 RepID=A0A835EGS3_9POAL|nr:hypothetical protein HU200_041366 [Digitaria exilis]CAB3483451.1 unnamed protein product [Digitaria exilis]
MATDAILETIKPRRSEEKLPVTTAAGASAGGGGGLRRRMSSVSAQLGPSLSAAASASIRRAQSMPSVKALAAAGALRRWWEWGIGWVMARRPPPLFMEMSDEEADEIGGCHCRGTWRHVLYKVRAGARRLLGRDGRPLKPAATPVFRYDSVSYAQNFDDGEA